MQTYTRRVALGTGLAAAGSLFLERAVAAEEPSDFVLDHAGREMVRLHQRGQVPRASTLALTSANLRLLASHPYLASVHRSMQGVGVEGLSSDQTLSNLRRSLRSRHGYTGTVQDLRNLIIDAPPDVAPSVLKDIKAGRSAQMLTKAANKLDELSIRFDTSGLSSPVKLREQVFPHVMRPVWDPGEGVEPCTTLAVVQFGLISIGIIFSMAGAGVIIGGIIAGMGLILAIIRWGAC
jgi:hypothetical protein